MPQSRPRPSEYSDLDRARLGKAVEDARRRAGFRSRPAFAQAIGIGKRSLQALERGESTVGARMVQDVARALGQYHPEWSEDTPWDILAGSPAPALGHVTLSPPSRALDDEAVEIIQDPEKVGTDEWVAACMELLDGEDLKAALRAGLEVRKRRRELQILLRQTTERIRPEGAGEDMSRVD